MAVAVLLTACAPSPVRWMGEPVSLAGPFPDGAALMLRGVPDRVRAVAMPVGAPAGGLPALGPGACLSSVRWSRSMVDPHQIAGAWWTARPDSSVVLRLARSADDGAHWDTTWTADDRDRGVRGCARPVPAVFLDPVSGYTHLAYFLEPATGAGVFYEHLMDPRGADTRAADTGGAVSSGSSPALPAMFHAPVAIVFGETPSHVGVAGHGDTVVVAYEDPNRAAPQVTLAVSVTAGHTFAPRLPVSGESVAGRDPLVGVRGGTVGVAWQEAAVRPDGASGATPANRAMVRIGTIQ